MMTTNLSSNVPSPEEPSLAVTRALQSRVRPEQFHDAEEAPYFFAVQRVMFKKFLLLQQLEGTRTVDDAWGVLEELSLKRVVRGALKWDDAKRWNRTNESIEHVGLRYVPARPEWDLEVAGVLQIVDPKRLEEHFPALASWKPMGWLFSFVRARLHEL